MNIIYLIKQSLVRQFKNASDKFPYSTIINVPKEMFRKGHIKNAVYKRFHWPKIRQRLYILVAVIVIVTMIFSPLGPDPIEPQDAHAAVPVLVAAGAIIAVGGAALGVVYCFARDVALGDTCTLSGMIASMVVGATTAVLGWLTFLFGSTALIAVFGTYELVDLLSLGTVADMIATPLENIFESIGEDVFQAAQNNPDDARPIIESSISEIELALTDPIQQLVDAEGGDVENQIIPTPILETSAPLLNEHLANMFVVSAVFKSFPVNNQCDYNDNSGEIQYVEFQYSVDQSTWSNIVSPDTIDSKDWYGCNGWGIRFDVPNNGLSDEDQIYLRIRAHDIQGNDSEWEVIGPIVVNTYYVHDYEVTNLSFTPSAPNVGDTVSVSADITNVGGSDEGSIWVELRKNGTYQNGANISALSSGSTTTASFNVIAEQGAHTYEIVAELSGDEDPTNDSTSGTMIVGTAPSLQVNGSSSPGTQRISATTAGSTGSFNITIQNIGSAATNVTVSNAGAKANWITLGTDPGVMDAYSTEYYNFSVNVPAGEPVGTGSAELTFSWDGGTPIILPIEFDVVSAGNGFETRAISPSSGTINGDISGSQIYYQPDYPFATRLDNYSSTSDPSSITRNFSLTESEYYRIQSDSTNEISVDVTEIEEDPNGSRIWYQLNTWERSNYSDYVGDYDILDELIIGQNSLTFGLTNFQEDLNNVMWDFEYALDLNYTTSAWWGTLNVSSSDLSKWSAGWDAGYVCAHIDSVNRAGNVNLFNNKSLVRTMFIDNNDVGDDICWRVNESDFETTNSFNFKANLNGAQVSMSNIHWEITYLSGRPALQATRSLSALQADVDQNVVTTLSFENIGTNFAVDPTYNDSLPTGLQLVTGSLSGEATDVDPGGTSEAAYTFKGTSPGTYVIPGSLVQYYDPSNFSYVILLNNSVVEIWGGTLLPTLDPLNSGVAGTPFSLSATLTDTLIGANVEYAQIIADITRPDSSVVQVALQWHSASGKYLGSYTPNQSGVHQIILNASKAYFDPGSSAATDWNVTLPNQAPVAHASYTSTNSGNPLEITLDASNTVDVDGIILSYVWDINNNGVITTTGRTVTHTFTSEGEYQVVLTVTDNNGESDTELMTIYAGALTFENPMQAGWNLVSIPIGSVTNLTAEALCQEIGSTAVEVDRWVAGGWDSHVCGLPFNDFEIAIGQGYFVWLLAPDAWSVTGTAITTQVNINFSPGWNLISLPQGISYTASQLGTAINAQGGSCSEIDQWLAGGWNSYIIGLPFNDFEIEPGEGYFVRCSGNSVLSILP